ncbi:MOSC domain-containing protein 1-like protein [Leptotrombidium deliense]|uniref:MOSC domain-containing protein 1-like protein n=1 Tax=Leptotrombidium deliense TaxID=299467 RepID=A0A443SJZ8_9ACAR|nr:MOSC domain-containing protein 1-like protein [Leptotrombidium deliense]
MTLKYASLAFITSVALISVYFLWKRRKFIKNVGQVKKLIIYPVKSLPGIEVESLEFTKIGVKYSHWLDRSITIVNSKNVVVTQRMKPLLALLKQSFVGDELWIEAPNQETLKIKHIDRLNDDSKIIDAIHCGKYKMKGMDCGDECATWIQQYLQADGYRLMRYVQELPLCDSFEWTGSEVAPIKDQQMIFNDGNAISVINDASVRDLNNKIADEQITFRNFRPNILLDCDAYSEDYFRELRINDILLRQQRKVERCVLVLVNPDTGIMCKEPLKTLRKYRLAKTKAEAECFKQSPFFGVNFCVLKEGIITVNDSVIAFIS